MAKIPHGEGSRRLARAGDYGLCRLVGWYFDVSDLREDFFTV